VGQAGVIWWVVVGLFEKVACGVQKTEPQLHEVTFDRDTTQKAEKEPTPATVESKGKPKRKALTKTGVTTNCDPVL